MKVYASLFLIFIANCFCFADDDNPLTRSSHYISGFFGQGQLILGSEDPRFGGGLTYAYGRPEPKFKWGRNPAQLVYETYIDHTQTPGVNNEGPNSTFAVGVLAYARWRGPIDSLGNGVYFDLGWGLQLADHPTVDLDSQLNSTPVAGFGGIFKFGKNEFMTGLRFLHISNAGLKRPNDGQNELFLMMGVRY